MEEDHISISRVMAPQISMMTFPHHRHNTVAVGFEPRSLFDFVFVPDFAATEKGESCWEVRPLVVPHPAVGGMEETELHDVIRGMK